VGGKVLLSLWLTENLEFGNLFKKKKV